MESHNVVVHWLNRPTGRTPIHFTVASTADAVDLAEIISTSPVVARVQVWSDKKDTGEFKNGHMID